MVSLKRKLISNIRNISSGARVNKHIVVFESDDWGSNCIASKADFDELVRCGVLSNDCDVYYKNDTLARESDLVGLFEVLSKYKGSDGNCAVFSTFVTPANPDFNKIRENGFFDYYYESFLETLEKTGEKDKVLQKWHEGIDNHLLYPEYHGREHLTVPLWMEALKQKDEKVVAGFNHNFYSVDSNRIPRIASCFRPTLYFEDSEQKEWLKNALLDGLNLIKDIFGINPLAFAPSNGVSHPDFDKLLFDNGVKAIHNSKRFEPDGVGGGKRADYGSTNCLGQIIYNRNCVFEPVQVSYDPVDFCLAQIKGAFNWRKAAIISTHRVNYMGSIDPKNRSIGLGKLHLLLKEIVNKWPDVIFMTTDEYVNLILKAKRWKTI
jgi:hypothetical protein